MISLFLKERRSTRCKRGRYILPVPTKGTEIWLPSITAMVLLTLYGHNAVVKVTAGDRVDSTTVIALSGNTGRSTGPHVHFEVRELAGYDKQRHEKLYARPENVR